MVTLLRDHVFARRQAHGHATYVYSVVPSPLAGEGGRRPGEGSSGARPLTPTPSPTAGRGENNRGAKHVPRNSVTMPPS
jgi:hypothetical protein